MALTPIRRALLSVSDKTGLVSFARCLGERGVEIVSTGGTAAALAEAGVATIAIESVTGFPEMMDGRIKTLHPAVHGALLARRDDPAHREALQAHDFAPIDLVCVNLYPFEQTIRRGNATCAEAIEQIDIGGPAMVRSAAKNHQFVTVVTSPDQYGRIEAELAANDGCTTMPLRQELAAAAFCSTAAYDAAIAGWMAATTGTAWPARLGLCYTRSRELRYGENPHQSAALYAGPDDGGPGIAQARVLHGKPLSYNNIQDAAAALELVLDLAALAPERACAAIIKHTNACGAAVAGTAADAFDLAYGGDPPAAYGGILAAARAVDHATAERICEGSKFLEVIIAPAFDQTALDLLARRWTNVRLLAVGPPGAPHGGVDLRSIPGGLLAQQRDAAAVDPAAWRHVAGPAPSAPVLADAALAWILAKHLKSNAIALARDGRMLGAGCGQVDRVTACRLAVEKAAGKLKEAGAAVAASDAFFPFPDGPKLLIDAGIACIVHPGGSKRDQETLDLCNQRTVTCLLTGVRHFRH